jgi:hypothetical protein
MNLRQRCQAVYQAGYKVGQQTFRSLAAATNLSKSSVHRLYHRLQRRNQYPESQLWETEAGQQWLRLLVFAAVFVFAVEGGIGCERLSEFFHLLRLQRHIGVSPSTLRRLRIRMEEKILEYQLHVQAQLKEDGREVELCAAADEKFFDQVVLVMLDLPSGYILVEELAENRQYQTWQLCTQQVLQNFGLKVKYFVSDRAKALVKLALNDLGCPSIADLFHALFELSKSLGWELNCLASRIEKRLEVARSSSPRSPELIKQLEIEQSLLQSSNQTYQDCSQRISTSIHPFAITDSSPQSSLQVKTLLSQEIHQLKTLKQAHRLKDQRDSINKLARQVQELAAVVDIWWSWVDYCLGSSQIESLRCDWIKKQLLPAVYWQQQVRRTKTGTLKKNYQLAYQRAFEALLHHPATASLSRTSLQQWLNWANWMVSKFQRSSSPVEGRNGYLSQVYHNRRGLSSRRLKVMTVIHNFHLQRRDGTTAAERLFGKKFPDLFEWVASQMGELPTPRKPRKLPLDTTASLPAVPS